MGKGMLPLSTFLLNPCRERCLGSNLLRSEGTSILEATNVPYTSTRETVPPDPNAFCMIPDKRYCRESAQIVYRINENHLVCRVGGKSVQCWGIEIAGLNSIL